DLDGAVAELGLGIDVHAVALGVDQFLRPAVGEGGVGDDLRGVLRVEQGDARLPLALRRVAAELPALQVAAVERLLGARRNGNEARNKGRKNELPDLHLCNYFSSTSSCTACRIAPVESFCTRAMIFRFFISIGRPGCGKGRSSAA